MRVAVLLALAGCRSILGIDEPATIEPPLADGASADTMPPDVRTAPGCPPGFMTLPDSGPRGHRYKLVDANAGWAAQRDACAAMGAYLAFPDGETVDDARLELVAITGLAGSGAWIGVHDLLTEGMHVTVLGAPVSAATQGLFGGSGAPSEDCMQGFTDKLEERTCSLDRKAACECVP